MRTGRPRKLIFGVGVNDADYFTSESITLDGVTKELWRCPYYVKWKSMLMRCYSESYQGKNITYKGCSVCEEWHSFMNFRGWMESQNWEDRHLDKDFLVEGNKVYSPDTCVFLPKLVNSFILTREAKRGVHPIGVYYKQDNSLKNQRKKPYCAMLNKPYGKYNHLGYYLTPEEAHQVYLKAKLEQCATHIEEFKDEPLIVKGLTRIKDKIQCHIENNLELASF